MWHCHFMVGGLFSGSFWVCLSCRSTFWFILGIVVWPYANWFCNMTSNAPTNFVRAYLRASTAEQDASRALETIELLPGKEAWSFAAIILRMNPAPVLTARNSSVFWEIASKMTFCLSRMWTDFPDCQGKTGIRWRKWSVRKISGLWPWMCRRPGLILVWVSLTAGCLQPLTICCWICWPLLPEGTMNNGGNARNRG